MLSPFHTERPCHQHAICSRGYVSALLDCQASCHQLACQRKACGEASRTIHGCPQELRAQKLVAIAEFSIGDPGSDMGLILRAGRKNSQAVMDSAFGSTDKTSWKWMFGIKSR